jgi:hypothetical protein
MTKRMVLIVLVTWAIMQPGLLPAAESPWETVEWGRMNQTQRFKWALDLYRLAPSPSSTTSWTRSFAPT